MVREGDEGGVSMSLYNVQRDRLLGKPSIESRWCPFCGAVSTNRHHIVPKGMGGTSEAARIPTVAVCGMGNASGCHKRLHDRSLELDWDDSTGWWRYRDNEDDCGWRPLRKEQQWQ